MRRAERWNDRISRKKPNSVACGRNFSILKKSELEMGLGNEKVLTGMGLMNVVAPEEHRVNEWAPPQ